MTAAQNPDGVFMPPGAPAADLNQIRQVRSQIRGQLVGAALQLQTAKGHAGHVPSVTEFIDDLEEMTEHMVDKTLHP